MLVSRYGYPSQFGDIDELGGRITELLLSGDYITGKPVAAFERNLADYLGAGHATGVNSGTDALILALLTLDVGAGDEVVTVANTFHATVLAIARVGARPVLVDSTDTDQMMDLDRLEAAITPRTKAIIAVHMFGEVLDMNDVVEVARKHGLAVVEDCAQAIGARRDGRAAGTFGDIGCFSFHPSKNLAAAGDAGAVVTSDPVLAERLRQLRNLGQREQNHHDALGLNSRMSSFQALVLDHKLPSLDEWNRRRRAVAARYTEALESLPVRVLDVSEDHVGHMYQVIVPERDRTLAELRDRGVDAVLRYPVPIARQPAFAGFGFVPEDYPNADFLAHNALCLPMRPDLTPTEIDTVTTALAAVVGRTEEN
ncbi:glutamine--scyllo-inositol aminotransferase [Lentzea aerocolonigenes]|uniref:Glutamine--scyllo-inositol aminotransferase n=1 Tax=Lentzea aerocolonigenes TaxID=68170 RepID=A0A0F0HBH7_LENAE|nr:DegT/DnrJ/EryC1/StrS family aminotransferase [Lentzea aerocolonigenes]KJK51692.1 glutamine--scyllo-inositol aminotransferase [Lentzea aerocolonigenes]